MRKTGNSSRILKGAIAEIAQELLSTIAGDKNIGETIRVVISDRYAKRIANSRLNARLNGHRCKELLITLPIQSVGYHDRSLARIKQSTTWEKQIPSAIAVKVDPTDPTTIGFDHGNKPKRFSIAVAKLDPTFLGNARELHAYGRRRPRCSTCIGALESLRTLGIATWAQGQNHRCEDRP